MPKSNKELAVDIALKMIEARPRISYGSNNIHITPALSLSDVCSIITKVSQTLDDIDKSE